MRHTIGFSAQHRWLEQHPEHRKYLNFKRLPHRTTISRRYKALYDTLQDFIAFVGSFAQDLEEDFTSKELFEDKSLFKAKGPVWHQKDRKENVQTYLALAVFTVQLAMIMNSVWGMPIRAIAHFKAVWP